MIWAVPHIYVQINVHVYQMYSLLQHAHGLIWLLDHQNFLHFGTGCSVGVYV